MVMHLIQQQQQPSILFPSKLDRLEMKPHEPKKKKGTKHEQKIRRKQRAIKKPK
jgi:hypothetical protein